MDYIKDVVIPHFDNKKIRFGLTGQKALILQDSMSIHLDNTIATTLCDAGINTFEFPPHSIHLTQILDGTSFSTWKSTLKKQYKTNMKLTHRRYEIVKSIRAFEQNTGFLHNIAAFRLCGFDLDLNISQNLTFDVKKIFERERAPQDTLIESPELIPKPKTRRIKIPKHNKVKTSKKVLQKKRPISELGNE